MSRRYRYFTFTCFVPSADFLSTLSDCLYAEWDFDSLLNEASGYVQYEHPRLLSSTLIGLSTVLTPSSLAYMDPKTHVQRQYLLGSPRYPVYLHPQLLEYCSDPKFLEFLQRTSSVAALDKKRKADLSLSQKPVRKLNRKDMWQQYHSRVAKVASLESNKS